MTRMTSLMYMPSTGDKANMNVYNINTTINI